MKKATLFAVSIAMLLVILSPVIIFAIPETYDFCDPNVRLLTVDTLYMLFNSNSIDNVRYSYSFIPHKEDALAEVYLDFEFTAGSECYSAHTSGTVNAIDLPKVRLWEGPLEGVMIIDGTSYIVSVGFVKSDDIENPQCTVSIQPSNNLTLDALVVFTFGKTVVNGSVRDSIIAQRTEVEGQCAIEEANLNSPSSGVIEMNGIGDVVIYDPVTGGNLPSIGANREWDFIKQGFSTFKYNTNIGGYALQSRAYFWPEDNAVAMFTFSYCSSIDAYWNRFENTIANSSVDKYSVTFEVGEKNNLNNSRIIGMEDFELESTAFSDEFMNIIDDALSLLGFGYSTISSILQDIVAEVDTTVEGEPYYTNKIRIEIDFSILEHVNFDSIESGIPFVYSLSPSNENTYVGGSIYNTTTTMRYRTEMYDTELAECSTIYHYAHDINMEFTVDLNSN